MKHSIIIVKKQKWNKKKILLRIGYQTLDPISSEKKKWKSVLSDLGQIVFMSEVHRTGVCICNPDPLFPVRLICGSLIVQKMSCDLRWTVQRNGLVLFDSERVWLCFLVWDCLVLGSSSSPTRPLTAICLRPLSSAPASLKVQTAGLIVKKSGTPAAILPLKRACEVLFCDAWGLSEASFRA